MKHLKYIVFGLLTLAVFSCQKEDLVTITSDSERMQPEWNPTMIMENTGNSEGSNNNDSGSAVSNSNGVSDSGILIITEGGESDDETITDPNNDPDQTKKKGKK